MLFDLVRNPLPVGFRNNEKYNKNQFWDKYVDIENFNYSKLNEINNFKDIWDGQRLFELQKQEMRNNERNFKNISTVNSFLKSINNTNLTEQGNEISEASTNAILGRIIELSNAVFISDKLNPKNLTTHKVGKGKREYNEGVNKDNYKKIEDKASKELIEEYERLYEVISAYTPEQRAILFKKYETILTKGFTKKLRKKEDYIQSKAFEAEQLVDNNQSMQNILKSLGLVSLQTADFTIDGKKMIQDTMIFSEADLAKNFEKGNLSFSVKGINYAVSNLGEMIRAIEDIKKKTENREITIQLSDELTQEMEKIQQFSIQTKSSIANDALLNKSGDGGRNSISLNELLENLKTYEKYLRLLTFLNNEYWTNTHTLVFQNGKESEDLEALTNYLLSKSIGKTNMSKNQLYLTSLGITPASKWMEIQNRMLKFNPAIKRLMRGEELTHSYTYSFENI